LRVGEGLAVIEEIVVAAGLTVSKCAKSVAGR
jgi:hypothetical protein